MTQPQVVEALQYWMDLSMTHRVHPPGIVEWGTTPRDFFERKVAMMWTTTGNLTNVRRNAPFPFGVAMLPAGRRRGSATGGGNIYVFKKANAAQREAAVHRRSPRSGASTPATSRSRRRRGRPRR